MLLDWPQKDDLLSLRTVDRCVLLFGGLILLVRTYSGPSCVIWPDASLSFDSCVFDSFMSLSSLSDRLVERKMLL